MMVLKNICKSYDGKEVLKNISFSVNSGDRVYIMGKSGVGKTTLIRLLLGLESPDSGHLDGVPEKKAVVFQEDRLCPELSAITNISLACPNKKGEIIRILTSLGLSDSMNKPVCELSGGMKRRVAIARALMSDYDIILLDEPLKGLDAGTKSKACDVINRMTAGKTLILVTHDREDAELLNCRELKIF